MVKIFKHAKKRLITLKTLLIPQFEITNVAFEL